MQITFDQLLDVARLAATVRVRQRAYFRERSTTNLIASKEAEKELDAALAKLPVEAGR